MIVYAWNELELTLVPDQLIFIIAIDFIFSNFF